MFSCLIKGEHANFVILSGKKDYCISPPTEGARSDLPIKPQPIFLQKRDAPNQGGSKNQFFMA